MIIRALCSLFQPDTDGTRVSKCRQLSQETRGLDPMLFQYWSRAVGGGPILTQHWSNPRVCWAPYIWKGVGFIFHTCVVQYPICYVGSSMCLHSKVHRSMLLVSLRYAQYFMCRVTIFKVHYAMLLLLCGKVACCLFGVEIEIHSLGLTRSVPRRWIIIRTCSRAC